MLPALPAALIVLRADFPLPSPRDVQPLLRPMHTYWTTAGYVVPDTLPGVFWVHDFDMYCYRVTTVGRTMCGVSFAVAQVVEAEMDALKEWSRS
jgi:hypothetical protein